MKVLVLGGTGWVGHNIVKSFHEAGHDVAICSRGRKSVFNNDIPDEIIHITADKTKDDDMAQVFKERFDIVIDSVPTEASIDNVFNNAKGLKHYLHCSSTGGYAPLPYIPGDESCPYDNSVGGWAMKGIMDSKVMDLFNRQGFPATVIRPSYITGPGMIPLDNMGGRREDFLSDILAEKTIDLPNDGQALRQPIQIFELARSFLLAVEHPHSIGQIYNICLEKAVTLSRYIQIIAQAFGREARINLMPVDEMFKKYGDAVCKEVLYILVNHMCFDISKARNDLGYVPRYTTECAIEEMARWSTKHLGLNK